MSHSQDSQEDRGPSLALTTTGPADTTADCFRRPPSWSTDLFLRCWLPQSCWEKDKVSEVCCYGFWLYSSNCWKLFKKQTRKHRIIISRNNGAMQLHYWNNTWHAEYIRHRPLQYCPHLAEKPLTWWGHENWQKYNKVLSISPPTILKT